MAEKRTALLVRCTEQEAEMIRAAARRERRTISGFILNAVMNRVSAQTRMQTELQRQPKAMRKAEAAGQGRTGGE